MGVVKGVALAGEAGVEVIGPVVERELLAGADEAVRPEGYHSALAVHGYLRIRVAGAVVVEITAYLFCARRGLVLAPFGLEYLYASCMGAKSQGKNEGGGRRAFKCQLTLPYSCASQLAWPRIV